MSKKLDNRNGFISEAISYAGYTAQPSKVNIFGARVGYDGVNWDGAFLDVAARNSGVVLPALVYPPAALATFIRTRKIRKTPKPGDIAFFSFSNSEAFAAPHVGLVTETAEWRNFHSIKVIEGMTASGLARGPQDLNGVYERVRFASDILAFARPDYRKTREEGNPLFLKEGNPRLLTPEEGNPLLGDVKEGNPLVSVRPSDFVFGKSNGSVMVVQEALGVMIDARGLIKGLYGRSTQSAYANWQRTIGFVQPDGRPTLPDLARLAKESGLFNVTE